MAILVSYQALLEQLELPDRAAAPLEPHSQAPQAFRGSASHWPCSAPRLDAIPTQSDAAGAPLVDDATCDELEEALRLRFRTAAADGTLLAGYGLIENLLQGAKLGEDAAVRAWTDRVLEDDAVIIRLAKAATQITQSHAEGDRVMRRRPSVHRPGLDKIVNVDRMIAQLDTLASAGPKDDASAIIRGFKLGLKAGWPFASEKDVEA